MRWLKKPGSREKTIQVERYIVALRIAVVGDRDTREAHLLGRLRHDRLQIQIAVGDVEDQDSIGLQVAQVDLVGLARQQMHGDGVA